LSLRREIADLLKPGTLQIGAAKSLLFGMQIRRSGCGRHPRCRNSSTPSDLAAGLDQILPSTPGVLLARFSHATFGRTAEVPLVSFRGLMYLGVAFALFILRRTRRYDNRRIDDRSGRDLDPAATKVLVYSRREKLRTPRHLRISLKSHQSLLLHHPARVVVVDVSDSTGKSEFP
jgi:hypothetical protein